MATPRAKVEVDIDLNLSARVTERALERGLRGAGLEGVRLVKEELSQPGSGRVYGNHQASAPGEAPAPDFGVLRESTEFDVLIRGGFITCEISVRGEQAEFLELGTGRIEPRPFLSTVLQRDAGRLFEAFTISARF